ncbi:MAG: hypothetical protein EOO61_15585 [Hymenobacter sp.]|nr:MAG: hypothetical protein EOO61_15585 [Hymenobacter sp.]
MIPSDNSAAPLGFPDLTLSIPYSDGLRYAQFRLKMLGRGDLKPFCVTHELPYTTVVNLKNGTLKNEEPRLLQRTLRSLSVITELVRSPLDAKMPRFLFPSQETLDTFNAQLKCFDSGTTPLEAKHHNTDN